MFDLATSTACSLNRPEIGEERKLGRNPDREKENSKEKQHGGGGRRTETSTETDMTEKNGSILSYL